MKTIFFIISFFSITFPCYSQSNKIVGSWILRDSVESMQFFTKEDGKIEQRKGLAKENLWTKTPRKGTYTFNDKGQLVITWEDKSIERRAVKFENNFKAAKITFTGKKNTLKRKYLFLKIVDEEILPDK